MKFIIILCLVIVSSPLLAETVEPSGVVKAQNDNAFKGLFYTVWNKFKTLSPKNENTVRNITVTMGVRGAETTSTLLQPYWKDDKTSDEKFMQQLESFAKAQNMADKGDLVSANKEFTGFIDKYPQSDLKPNAQFAAALTMGAMGKMTDSKNSFKVFIDENPDHPLVSEAHLVMKELN